MLTTVICAGLLSGMHKLDRIELPFRSSVARFKTKHWNSIAKLGAMKVADTPAGIANADWIYFDLPGNKVILGGEKDSLANLVEFIKQFDVVPKRLRLETTFERKDLGFKMNGVLETDNNETVTMGSQESNSFVSIKPRLNDDGTLTLSVGLKKDEDSVTSAAVRMKLGHMFWVENARFDVGQVRHPIGSGGIRLPEWNKFNDYVISIKPSIVD